jgi:hypothetical protein
MAAPNWRLASQPLPHRFSSRARLARLFERALFGQRLALAGDGIKILRIAGQHAAVIVQRLALHSLAPRGLGQIQRDAVAARLNGQRRLKPSIALPTSPAISAVRPSLSSASARGSSTSTCAEWPRWH